MGSARRIAILSLLALCAAGSAAAQGHTHHPVRKDAPPAEQGAEEQAVRAVVDGFSRALAAGDSARALSYLHPEVVVYEGGHAETLQQYRSGHLRADVAFLQSVTQETTRSRVAVGTDLALYLSEYTSKGTFRGREIDSHGTETMVLARTPEGWKIRHIHWSSSR